jgi:signal transduction histidine kinase
MNEAPLPPGDQHPYPEWLRLGPLAEGSTGEYRRLDAAWRLWEHLSALERRYAMALDTALAVGLFLVCSGWFVLSNTPHPDLGFVAGLTLPLILRRRAPIAVFAVVAAVALAQWSSNSPLLADTALLVALCTVAADSHWVQVVVASVVLEIGVIMATVRWVPTGSHLKSMVFLSGLAFAALSAGVVVRALRSQMGWLAERAVRLEHERDQQASLAAAAERARIAREMHDVVSHNLQVMVTLSDAAATALPGGAVRSAETLREVSGTGRQALNDMRRLLGVLRDAAPAPAPAPAGDLPFAPQPGLGQLEPLAQRVRATGLDVSVKMTGARFDLSEAAELTVYRIIQEALTNAMKHAGDARSVMVKIAFDDPMVSVRVTDDGTAAEVGGAAGLSNGSGHGMTGMAERAAAFGGTLRAGPSPDGGWEIEATLRGCRAPARV